MLKYYRNKYVNNETRKINHTWFQNFHQFHLGRTVWLSGLIIVVLYLLDKYV